MDALLWLVAEAEKKRRERFSRLPQQVKDELCRALAAIAANYAAHAGGFNAEFSGTIDTIAGIDADLVFEYCLERLKQQPLTMQANVLAAGLTAASDGERMTVEARGPFCGDAVIEFGKNAVVAVHAKPCKQKSAQQATQPQSPQPRVQSSQSSPSVDVDLDLPEPRLTGPKLGDELELE